MVTTELLLVQGLDVRKAGWRQPPRLKRAGFGGSSDSRSSSGQGLDGSLLASADGEVQHGLCSR